MPIWANRRKGRLIMTQGSDKIKDIEEKLSALDVEQSTMADSVRDMIADIEVV